MFALSFLFTFFLLHYLSSCLREDSLLSLGSISMQRTPGYCHRSFLHGRAVQSVGGEVNIYPGTLASLLPGFKHWVLILPCSR